MSINAPTEKNTELQHELSAISAGLSDTASTEPYNPAETRMIQNEQEAAMLLDLQKKLREYPIVEVECRIDSDGFLAIPLQPWSVITLENRTWVIRSESGKIDIQNGGILEIELPNGQILSSVIFPHASGSGIVFHRTSE